MTMTMSERGRLGGLATFRRHGSAHMAEIGRKGFRKLAQRLKTRRGAVGLLQRKGRMVDPHPWTMTDADLDVAHEQAVEAGYRAATGAICDDDPPF